ncbi:hypothetical protein WG66_010086 [Moniliophthora roreri]|nr:hypothetical protein WG66_010086 [Moniliophthora roreri]
MSDSPAQEEELKYRLRKVDPLFPAYSEVPRAQLHHEQSFQSHGSPETLGQSSTFRDLPKFSWSMLSYTISMIYPVQPIDLKNKTSTPSIQAFPASQKEAL